MDEDRHMTYTEIKEMFLKDYHELRNNEQYTIEEAVGYLTEDSIFLMSLSPQNYINTIVVLCVICLDEGALMDYLYERFLKLDLIENRKYIGDDKNCLDEDKKNVEKQIKNQNYQLLEDVNFKARVDMLLEKINYYLS
jgi:hypothetical protein